MTETELMHQLAVKASKGDTEYDPSDVFRLLESIQHSQGEMIDKMHDEKLRLRKALDFYANKESYKDDVVNQWEPVCPVTQDSGEIARKALEGLE